MGGDWALGAEPHEWDECPWERGPRDALAPMPWEDPGRGRLWEPGSPQPPGRRVYQELTLDFPASRPERSELQLFISRSARGSLMEQPEWAMARGKDYIGK